MAKTIGPLFTLLVLIAVAAFWRTSEATRALQVTALAQTSDAAECIAPSRLTLTLGVGDDAETDWSGRAAGWVTGVPAWSAKSASSPLKRGDGSRTPRIVPATAEIDLPEGPCVSAPEEDRVLQVETAQGSFEVAPLVGMGFKQYALDRRVEVARGPLGVPVADTRMEEDYPDCALLNDGSVLCAYVEFDPGQPVDEQAALAGDFSSIEFDGAGDRVALIRRVGATWGEATYATGVGRDAWRPAVSALPEGGAAVFWSEQRDGNWDIYARRFDTRSGTLAEEKRLTTDPGSDINVVASGGYYAWQGRRGLGFDIFVSRLDGEAALVSSSDANDWRPSITTDSKGAAWIAWDTYDVGNYDVKLRRFDGRELGESIAIAASHRFEARASVAVDQADRVWVAFEDSAEDWGKDAGDRWPGKQASPLYVSKNVLVRVWDGELKQTVGPPIAPRVDYIHDDPFVSTTSEHRISIPRLAFDATGTPWVVFRKHPLQTGRGERWRTYAAYYGSSAWSAPIGVRESDHLLDRQPALVALPNGSVLMILAGDRREQNVRDRQNSDLFEAFLQVDGDRAKPRFKLVDATEPRRSRPPVHPDEIAQVTQIRTKRVRVAGQTLRFLRGEFHRHTAFSAHRDWDGPFEEVWRYGLDVADMDWIGPGDHDYAVGQDYMWWLQQKAADMYHNPGAFSAMYTYERSVSYPSGHRNVILPRRGIRPVPRMAGKRLMEGTEADGSPDIKNLYAYLRHFDAICSSHTSATNMGTDWRDWDRNVEPVVELFQGHRQSYELSGGPRAATGPEDTIQGYRPLGFIWEAFKKGRRLGFQASSDHVSTHISYAIVLAEENSREAIIEGFKRRHSYAAHDNIILVVRSGDHLMGDEFTSSSMPKLEIAAEGTAPIDRVEIVRQVGAEQPAVVAAMEPRSLRIDLDWSDPAAAAGEWNMYYVRLEQRNSAMAWASPLWIRYEP